MLRIASSPSHNLMRRVAPNRMDPLHLWNTDTETHMRHICAAHAREIRDMRQTCARHAPHMSFAKWRDCQRRLPRPLEKWDRLNSAPAKTADLPVGEFLVAFSPQSAGFPPPTGQHGVTSGSVSVRTPAMAWMSDELIAETRRVWSAAYGRVISADEAVEILGNVRRFAAVMLQANLEGLEP